LPDWSEQLRARAQEQAAAAEAKTAQVRKDQFQCPKCGAWGAPRIAGRMSAMYLTRYRKCSTCGHSFSTRERMVKGELCGTEEVA
jgi:predicted RNA-binding Zn-ribbon protein involved in translation (DUF1610 family)